MPHPDHDWSEPQSIACPRSPGYRPSAGTFAVVREFRLQPRTLGQQFALEGTDAFLECGILARGFVRLRCDGRSAGAFQTALPRERKSGCCLTSSPVAITTGSPALGSTRPACSRNRLTSSCPIEKVRFVLAIFARPSSSGMNTSPGSV